MQDVAVENFGASARITFDVPLTADEAQLPRRAKEMLSALSAYGVQPKDLTLSLGDGLFNYRLQITLFGGAGLITLTAEEVSLECNNARTFKDWETIDDCFLVCLEHLNLSDTRVMVLLIQMHAAFFTEQDRNRYLAKWSRLPDGFEFEGLLARTSEEPFSAIELRIERSFSVEAGVYLVCRGYTPGEGSHAALLTVLWITMQELMERFELSLRLKEAKV